MLLGELFLAVSDETRRVVVDHAPSDTKEALEFAIQLVLPQNVFESSPTYCDVSSTEDGQLGDIRLALTSVSETVVPGNSDMSQIQTQQMELMLRTSQQRVTRLSSHKLCNFFCLGFIFWLVILTSMRSQSLAHNS